MKKIILFFSVALLISCGNKNNKKIKSNGLPKAGVESVAVSGRQLSIAYVDMDSLTSNYKFCVEEVQKLQKKQASFSEKLNKEAQGLQKAYASYQEKMKNGKITSEKQARDIESSIQKQKNILDQHQQQYAQQMNKASVEYQNELKQRLTDFLQKYNKEHKISIVLTNSSGGMNVLYADPGLNITADVVEGLNSEYGK